MTPVAYAGTLTYYFHTDCANGFTDAYVIVAINETGGCVDGIWGVDCSGAHFSFVGKRDPRSADLGLAYDKMMSGVVPGVGPWYAKYQLGPDGAVSRAWGRQANGDFYEVVLNN
jgi:hypothetical protein